MPLRYRIHKEHRLVVTTASDSIGREDILAHQQQLLTDPAFDPTFDQLIDVTELIELSLSPRGSRTVARTEMFSRNSRRAFVTAREYTFVMGRLLEAYHEFSDAPSQTRVFDSMPPALEWLGLQRSPR